MKVSELGEFGLIELIAGIVDRASGSDLMLGIGDDAAVWHTEKSVQVGTTDILIQDVHFTLHTATWRDLGWKALAINISDIAAMGGLPRRALVSLGMPPETEVESVCELYRGLAEIASKFGVEIAGGNISRAPQVIISVSLIGNVADAYLTRSSASPGDQIAVSGYLGQAAAGLKMLNSDIKLDEETATFLREAHLRPYPRVEEGQILVHRGVRTAIDVSDGLIGDLAHICEASQVGARIWIYRLPVHPLVTAAFKDESLRLALSGGEDYELLFTAGKGVVDQLKEVMSIPVTVIGEITEDEPGRIILLDDYGKVIELVEKGWEHFSSHI